MSGETIIRMANQIATFFRTAADGDAPAQVAAHINAFWEPRMRKQLLEVLETENSGLDAEVRAARTMIRAVGPEVSGEAHSVSTPSA